MKTLRLLLASLFFLGSILSIAQQKPEKRPWYKPVSLYADARGHVTWHFEEGINGGWVDWLNFNANLTFPYYSIVFSDQLSFYDDGTIINQWEQAYLNLFYFFTKARAFPQPGTRVSLKLGMIKWQPSYTDVVLVSEKYMSDYFSPENRPVYGACFGLYLPLVKKNMLNIRFDDLMGWYQDSENFTNEVKNAYLQGNLTIYKNLSIHAQAGLADGYTKVFNYGYLEYEPRIENLLFDFRLGYLPGYESTPWGISIEVRRPFNYVELGGYYQYRIGWDPHAAQIAGFTFRFLKPKTLVDIWNSYNFWYNFYDNTFYFNIPFIRINLGYK
jgi:hypothetical protein